MSKTEFPQSKKYTKPDGTVMYLWDSKLHNWDGPALIPEGDNKKREYYLYGIQYTEKEWKARKKQLVGLPFYKMPGTKART
jgi:hypothetical protein